MEDARHYMRVIEQSWRIILVTAVIACVVAVAVSFALPKTYESETRVLVAAPDTAVNVFGTALPELATQKDNSVPTQAELMRSRTLYQGVIDQLGLPETAGSFARHVSITQVNQTAVVSIKARASDPQTASKIANALATRYLTFFRNLKQESLQVAGDAVQAEVTNALADLNGFDKAASAQGLSSARAAQRGIAADRLTVLSAKLGQLRVNQQIEEGWGIVTDQAVPSTQPVGATPLSSGLVGLVAGLVFGIIYVTFTEARSEALPRRLVPAGGTEPEDRSGEDRARDGQYV